VRGMTSSARVGRQEESLSRSEAAVHAVAEWVRRHRQAAVYIVAALVVAVLLATWTVVTGRQTEQRAAEQLNQARFAFENQNLPLAVSEFARVIENFSGTKAAEEAMILLAQVRLVQGQSEQAVQVLRDFAPNAGPAYRAQAYGLLGAAYENLGRSSDAATAYEEGSRRALWRFLAAQLLSDAGRAWTAAGDTGRAVAAYQRIVLEYDGTAQVTEAKVRVGELTRGR
jgi:tetratricopeptide (TPR) repeat protein